MPTPPKDARPAPLRASDDRERQARVYLTRVRPAVLALGLVIASIDVLLVPESITTGTWLTIAGFAIVQPLLLLVLYFTSEAGRAAGISFLIDGVIFICILPFIVSPTNAAASLVILITAFAYFRSPRETVVYSILLAAAITTIGPHIPHWNDPAPFPASAFTVLATGLLLAYLTSRMRRTEDQLERVVAEQEHSLAQLKQIGRVRDRLIMNVSHELRTPLTSTIGAIETLLRDDIELEPDERTALMRLARDGGHRLLALVEDLLTVGSTRPDSMDLHIEPIDLSTLAGRALGEIQPVDGRPLTLDERTASVVLGDRMRVMQVVVNLVTNAMRHGAGNVAVEIDQSGSFGVLRVLDDGDGIARENLDELFLPFARFSTRADSTGLGLAICRALVEAQGGSIRYSRVGARTCFTVMLPVDVSDEPTAT